MKSGTAIGLLVGGAVLLLATSRRAPAAAGQPTVYPNAGGALNPFNWFGANGSGAMIQPSQIFGPSANAAPMYQIPAAQPAMMAPAAAPVQTYAYSPAAYSPYAGYAGAYAGGYTPTPVPNAAGGVGYDFFPVMTPSGGFQDYTQLAPGPANTQYSAATAASPAYA